MALNWWRQLAFELMSRAARRGRRSEQPHPGNPKPCRPALRLERLESRILFDVTPALVTGGVTFTGASTDNLYLEAVGGVLEWSTDGTTFSSNLAPGGSSPQTLTLNSGTTVLLNGGGALHLDSMTGAAGTFQSTGPLSVDANAVVSSQVLDSHSNPTANAQDLRLLAPVITLNVGAQIQAGAAGNFLGGQVSLLASDTETGATAQGNAQVNINGAAITGSNITVQATSTLTVSAGLPINTLGAGLALINAGSAAAISVTGATQIRGTGTVTLAATSNVQTVATALTSTSGGSVAVDGAFASSTVASSALTTVSGTAQLSAGPLLSVSATNDATVTTTADGADSGSNAAGASIAVAVVTGDTRASLDSGASASATEIEVSASSVKNVTTRASSAAGGATQNSHDIQSLSQNNAKTQDGNVQVAGALAFTSLQGTTDAHAASSGLVNATNVINIDATSSNATSATADGSATWAAATGVGVAVAVDVAGVDNHASLGGSANLHSQAINVQATTPAVTPNVFSAQATSGVGNASKVGVAGSLAVNVVSNSAEATVQPGATVAAGGANVMLLANNTATESATAKPSGSGAIGGSVGVGASVALDVATNTTEALVGDNAVLTGANSLTLSATSSDTVTASAQAGASGGTAVSPVAAIAIANNTTLGQLGVGGTSAVTGSLGVSAVHAGGTTSTADASAAGGTAAVGAALALTLANDTTTSTTERAVQAGGAVSFTAAGAAASSAQATGSAGGAQGEGGNTPSNGVDQQLAGERGFADTQASADGSEPSGSTATPSAKTSDGSVSVAAAVGVNVDNSIVEALIPAAGSVLAGGLLLVSAASATAATATADGSETDENGSPKVGVGATVALNLVNAKNQAAIGSGAQVQARGVTVAALMNTGAGSLPSGVTSGGNSFSASAMSGAGASNVGVAGSVALNLVTNVNQALIEQNAGDPTTTVNATGGDLTLTAQDNTVTSVSAMSKATGGKVGVGASVALNLVTIPSTAGTPASADAEVQDNVALSNVGDLSLMATSADAISTTAQAGSGGGKVGVSPAVALSLTDGQATARLGAGTTLMAGGSVTLQATHTGSTSTTASGTAAGSSAAIGAAIALTIANDQASATTARDISAAGAVTFEADNASASSAGSTASASGADGDPSTSGSAPAGDGTVDGMTGSERTFADGEAQTSGGMTSGSDPATPSAKTSDGAVSVAAAVAVNVATSTARASIPAGQHVTAGGLLTVHSSNDTDGSASADGTAGGATVDSNKVGVGAAVALNLVNATNQATIGSGAQVQAQGVTVEALMNHGGTGTDAASPPGVADGANTFSASATSGAGASNVGVAGALALNLVTDTNQALIEQNAGTTTKVDTQGGNLTLTAQDNSVIGALATSIASAGKVGVGASVALNIITSPSGADTADAEVQDGVALTRAARVALTATSNQAITTSAQAGSAGTIAVTPSVAVVFASPDATAYLGSGATLQTTGDVSIAATNTTNTTTTAGGYADGQGKVGVGVSLSLNIVESSANATLARSVTAGGAVSVSALTMGTTLAQATASENGAPAPPDSGDPSSNSSSSSGSPDSQIQQQFAFGQSFPGTPQNMSAPTQSGTENSSPNPSDSTDTPSNATTGEGGGSSGIATVGVAAAIGVNVASTTSVAAITGGANVSAVGPINVTSTNQNDAYANALGTSVINKTSVGAALSINVAGVTNQATLGSNVQLSGNGIAVAALQPSNNGATLGDDFRTWALSAAAGQQVGVAGSVGINVITDNTQAALGGSDTVASSGALTVNAANALTLRNIDGAAGLGLQNAGVGASIAVNLVNNTTTAEIGSNTQADAADATSVTATASLAPSGGPQLSWEPAAIPNGLPNPLIAVAGGAGSATASVAGSVAINLLDLTTTARVDQSARVNTVATGNADQDVTVQATDTLTITDGAGGVSGGGRAGVGLGFDVGIVTFDTEAYVAGSATVDARRNIALLAATNETITSLAVEFAAGGYAGVAGSVSVYILNGTTEAHVDGPGTANTGTVVHAGGNLSIAANAPETLMLLAGNVTLGGTAVGVANTTLLQTDHVEAYAGPGADLAAHGATGLSVTATASENVTSLAAGGAGGANTAVAGSAVVNVWNDTTLAYLDHGTHSSVTSNVAILASDTTTVFSTGGAVSVSGSNGVGAGVDVGLLTKDTEAYIAAAANVTATGDVSVQALSNENITSVTAALAIGSNSSLAGSAGVYVLTVTTRAFIGQDPNTLTPGAVAPATNVTANGNVEVAAAENTTLFAIAGNANSSGTAVGGAVALPIITKTTESFLGPNASVTALGLGGTISPYTGHFTAGTAAYNTNSGAVGPGSSGNALNLNGTPSPTDSRLTQQRTVSPDTTALHGVAVSAINTDDLDLLGVSGGASGEAAIVITGAVNLLTTTTRAYVAGGATVNANNAGAGSQQSVLVAAGDDYSELGIAAGIGIGGGVSATPDANVLVVTRTTDAYVDNGASVNALKDVTVAARASEDILDVTVAAGASGGTGLSGAATVISLTDTTLAYVGEDPGAKPPEDPYTGAASVTAGGDVLILSTDNTLTYSVSGSLGIGLGSVGVGGALGMTVLTKDTEAYVGVGAVVNAGGNSSSLNNGSVYAGTITAGNFDTLPSFSGLAVQAVSTENVVNIAGAGGVGFYVGLGGGVTVEVIQATTRAFIDNNATVNANTSGVSSSQSVNVTALNNDTVFTFAGGVGIAGTGVGVGGGIDVGLLEDNTAAFIGSNAQVNAQQDVSVNALSGKNVTTIATSGAGGLAALAGSVSVWTIGSSLNPTYSDNGQSSNSLMNGGTGLSNSTNSGDGEVSMFGGLVGGYGTDTTPTGSSPSAHRVQTDTDKAAGMVPGSTNASNPVMNAPSPPNGTAAYIAAGATVHAGLNSTQAGHVNVQARENIGFNVTVGNVSIGAVGIGGSVAIATIQSNTQAYIGDNATVNPGSAGNIVVAAALSDNATGNAYAGNAGLIGLGAQVVVLKDTSTQSAYLGNGVTIPQAASLTVQATVNRTTTASAIGGTLGVVAAGVAEAQAQLDGGTTASMGNNDVVGGTAAVGNILVNASDSDTATAKTLAVAVGIGTGTGNIATATSDPTVSATVGNNSALTAGQTLTITASAIPVTSATSLGVNAGGLTVGFSQATATASPTLTAATGTSDTLTTPTLTIEASRSLPAAGPSAYASASAASGSLIGINATVSNATGGGSLTANVGNGSTLAVSGTALVEANSQSQQEADVTGIQIGILAVGADLSYATSNVTTQAYLGQGVAAAGGTLSVMAVGADTNNSNAVSGSGGVISGTAAEAHTNATSSTLAYVSGGDLTRQITVNSLNVTSSHTETYNAEVNSLGAAAVGASGALASNMNNSDVESNVGSNAYIRVHNLTITANNTLIKPALANGAYDVMSGSGGIIDLPAARSDSTASLTTSITVGAGAHLETYSNPNSSPGVFQIEAQNNIQVQDQTELTSGGAIAVAKAESSFMATTDSATVTIGSATLLSVGPMNIAALAAANVKRERQRGRQHLRFLRLGPGLHDHPGQRGEHRRGQRRRAAAKQGDRQSRGRAGRERSHQ